MNEKQLLKLQAEINNAANRLALQQFVNIKNSIIEQTGISDLAERLTDIPAKKGRPNNKKRVFICLKNSN